MFNEVSNEIPRWIQYRQRYDKFRGSTSFIVFTVSLAIFTDSFLYGVIVPVVPFAFHSRFGIPENEIQKWVSTSLAIYAVGVIAGSLVVGVISDRFGRRRLFMISGFVVMEGATSMLCFPKSLTLYMIGRALQGIAAAIAWGIGYAIISDSAEGDQIALLMSYPSIGLGLGFFLGPLLGGVMYEKVGYYSVFYLCFAIFTFDILVRFMMTEKHTLKKKLEQYAKYEKGPVVETTQEQAGSQPSEEEIILPSVSKSTVLLLLKSPRVLNDLFLIFILVWFSGALDAVLTIHVSDVFHFDSLYAGLMFLAIIVPGFLDPLWGWLSDKYGPKYIVTFGFIWLFPSFMLLRIPDHNSTSQIVMFVAFLAMMGIGFSVVLTPLMAEMASAVIEIDKREPGRLGRGKGFAQAYGLVNIASSLGQLVGPYQAGAAMTNHGWAVNCLILALLALVAAVPSYFFTGGNKQRGEEEVELVADTEGTV